MNSRKRAVSIRMTATDIGSVKKLARRLGVSDSDVIRCAVKMMMAKLGPLADAQVRGRNLVPVFVESGTDLFRYFDLDAIRLDSIINEGATEGAQVDPDDIQLLAMNGLQRSYIKLRLSALGGNGNGTANGNGQHADAESTRDKERLDDSLRQYLYDKYVYRAQVNGKQLTEA